MRTQKLKVLKTIVGLLIAAHSGELICDNDASDEAPHLEDDAGQPKVQLEEEASVQPLELGKPNGVQGHILASPGILRLDRNDGVDLHRI